MSLELREEAVRIMYRDGEPVFIVKNNGNLTFYKVVPATMEDMHEAINSKSVDGT